MVLRRSIFALCALSVLIPGPATAADDWAGLYVGGETGALWQSFDHSFRFDGTLAPGTSGGGIDNQTNWLGAVYGGYNHQLGNLVLGIEGDVTWGPDEGSDTLLFRVPGDLDDTFTALSRLGTLSSIRGRIGLAWDRALVFATAGVAFADVATSVTVASTDGSFGAVPSLTFSDSDRLTGWTVGGGIEYALSSNWLARAEYRHTDLGDLSFSFTDPVLLAPAYAPDHISTDVTLDDVRVGIAYKF